MPERKKTTSKKKNQIKIDHFPNIEVKHAHFANFHSSANDVIISFLQVIPPIADGAPYDMEIKCVSRLLIDEDDFADFVESVNSFWENRKEVFPKEENKDDKENEKK